MSQCDPRNLDVPVPDRFIQTQISVYGQAGLEWIRRLPAIVQTSVERWSLELGPTFSSLTYNWVAPVTRPDGSRHVLKIGYPSRELMTEIDMLQLCDGRGMVRLIDADRSDGALLLERLEPGKPVSSVRDDERETAIAAEVMQRIWHPVPASHAFPSVADWATGLRRLRSRYDGRTGPLPGGLVEQAEHHYADLLYSMDEPVVLHGDLHHDNILSAHREPWLTIDPKGVVGEREYETGAWLRNPLPQLLQQPDPAAILARRIDQLSEQLGFDRDRLRAWAIAQAVLSAWWCVDDNQDWRPAVALAELLAT